MSQPWTPRGFIGVVHLPPMPGDPACDEPNFDACLRWARRDAQRLVDGGVDAIIVENFGSAPFARGTAEQPAPPQHLAAITLAVAQTLELGVPVGVNVLRNDAMAAMGIAAATGAHFIRVNVHVGAYVTDQGLIQGRAYETLRYRRALQAQHINILADVRVKHATPVAPVDIATEVGDCLLRGGADAVIVTGSGTGKPVDLELLRDVRRAAQSGPVFIGSGMTPERAITLGPLVQGAIVGTWIKENGDVRAPVDVDRVRAMAAALRDVLHAS
ncbi:MAG: membrane complex biogenesis BtpA family protein [Kiritimatiellia bacterium]|jgi:membrane complex biogenesis BtpA family protein